MSWAAMKVSRSGRHLLVDDRGEPEAASKAPSLRITNVTKAFGGVVAVNEISLTVPTGSAVGVIGPNGAGKSTLLKLISGVIRPDSGTIEACGRPMTGLSPHHVARAGVVLASQIPRPFRSLSVHDNVAVALRVRGDGGPGGTEDVLAACGLEAKAHARAAELGLLDLKRLEVARALATDPAVLLLDEVAAGLSGQDLDQAIDLVARIHARGTTIVLVEHIERVIREVVDRVVVLNWGRLIADGTPAEIEAHAEVRAVYVGGAPAAAAARPAAPAQRPTPEVRVAGVSARYGDVVALDDVTVDVGVGEVVAVIGANGAGKSTLASVVSGQVTAARGSVSLFGAQMTNLQPHLRARQGIAHCPEGRHVFADLTVRENLEVSVPIRTSSSDSERRLDAVHDIFPMLAERARQRAGTLSGGEQQMLSIARALMTDPKLLVCDELSLGLAPVMTSTIYDALRRIASRGVMLLAIEQDVRRCLEIADHVYVLLRGRVSYSGPPGPLMNESFLDKAYFGRGPQT